MIDTSGSMSGTPMNNAKTAGSLLVGQLTPGENAVGVGRFTSSASQVFAITDIPDPDTGVRAAAQSAISAFVASGGTNIEGAALTALAQVQGFQGGTRPSVVYLLTDGQSSVNVANVVNQYTAAKVPLITFGFGSSVDTALLQSLANGTGGQYFFSPTSLAAIQQAFIAANAAFSSSVVVSSGTAPAAPSTTEVRTIPLDSTMATAAINVTYGLAEADVSLRLLDSTGADTGLTFTCNATSEVSCDTEVDVSTLGAGDYGLEITNNTAGAKDVSVLVSGSPSTFENYDIAVQFDNANYPASFGIQATVSAGAALTGLDVVARVTKPDNSTVDIPLLDDGRNGDLNADDGTYSADVAYDMDGTYTAVVTASNAAGNAQTTFNSVAIAVGEDGNGITPTPTNVTENFTRTGVANAVVAGMAADDHSDDPTVPGACTAFTDDNVDVVGRIDAAGDVDCFFFTPTATSDDLIARITSLRMDMEPVIRVYDPTGTTELLMADLATSENDKSGVIVTIPAGSLDAAGHVVTIEHSDAAATAGGYALSVGAKLVSDEPAQEAEEEDTGGAVGPLGLLFAALLAAVGLRQRRRFV
ncbi:von Willebrand factor type A domain-containing protein [Thalassovita litoralis]|uniref:von Willebrand factor type A domain-containing protein n=1 Tax=Thalassovita litoralis TaxID=1010611 RepID=A0A521EUM7_9RHOB|nr:VWA domain-containing protein [Thalassovita litoralis]SMO87633.1 von Willebrand factor type A domain-containing protein [Thalassovita litoralis]